MQYLIIYLISTFSNASFTEQVFYELFQKVTFKNYHFLTFIDLATLLTQTAKYLLFFHKANYQVFIAS